MSVKTSLYLAVSNNHVFSHYVILLVQCTLIPVSIALISGPSSFAVLTIMIGWRLHLTSKLRTLQLL